ncbi:hypothetical protein PO883_23270 [Massilia sp. DJPM01]|uniref:hypothetical protein n=1 Tax=Massilia sp. DJPM01 TaxID=3024404 RepID=UPI00259D6835|nr:hypothetical protein [Massilia sp. DJPM01]MDM5180110.1 hypothetical protein [Massilia sp. DJPM01]
MAIRCRRNRHSMRYHPINIFRRNNMLFAWRLVFVGWMLIMSAGVFAQDRTAVPRQVHASAAPARTAGDIKTELIRQMQNDGYLSERMAKEVAGKYVSPGDFRETAAGAVTAQASQPSVWSRYMSWVNLIKVVAVICFLVVFYETILKLVKALWTYVIKVPTIVYQLVFLSLTGAGTLWPEAIWPSQALYVALFCGFANVLLVGWIVDTCKVVPDTLKKLFPPFRRAPVSTACALGMVYFGALALMHQSGIFGFFAAVCLSGVLSFYMVYTPGTLYLKLDERMLKGVVVGHLSVLAAYCVVRVNGIHWESIQYFEAGLEYYCTIGLALALLVGASPWPSRAQRNRYLALFIVLAILASLGYLFLDLKVIASILLCFFVLLLLEWIAYLGFKTNVLIGAGALGASLYGIAVLLEKYSSLILAGS